MRHTLSFAAVVVLLVPAMVAAQDAGQPVQEPDVRTSNFFDFGARATAFASGSDQARFERYRDLRDGATLDIFRWANDTDRRRFTVQADHVGYRDQRYSATYDNFGKLKVSFEWNQIPLFYSQSTATPFAEVTPGVLRLDDSLQSGVQNKTTTLATAVGQPSTFDLLTRRDVLDLRVRYSPTRSLDWNFSLRNTTKTGSQPWAGTFGFSDAVELAVGSTAPLDTRTTEVGTSVEWSNSRALARIGYDGSFFRNHVSTLVWDNPLRVTDSPTLGPAQGRMALWPNSDQNAISGTGTLNLPAHSKATAYLSVAGWSQNDPLIPFTINSALPVIPLDRQTADAKATVTAMNYDFSSKPTSMVWLNARFRSYDFDNKTPVFNVTRTVSYDTTVAAFAEGGTSPYSFRRRTFDADASFTPIPYSAFRVGYTRENVKQSFRTFDTTNEDTFRVSADTAGISWLTLRGVYEHGKRTGSGLDEQTLDDIGEQVSLRQFDIADRTTDRFSLITQVTPFSSLGLNGSVSIGKEDRSASAFGLRSNDNHSYSIGADFVPGKNVSAGFSYEYDKFTANQASRQANPGAQFDDPSRNWTTDTADYAHTFTSSLDLLKLWPKTDLRFSYNLSHAESSYVYTLASNFLAPNSLMQLPRVINELQRGTADVRYYVTAHVAAGFAYWFDKYRVNDFAMGTQTINTLVQPAFLTLGYTLRPYTANTFMGRVTYLW